MLSGCLNPFLVELLDAHVMEFFFLESGFDYKGQFFGVVQPLPPVFGQRLPLKLIHIRKLGFHSGSIVLLENSESGNPLLQCIGLDVALLLDLLNAAPNLLCLFNHQIKPSFVIQVQVVGNVFIVGLGFEVFLLPPLLDCFA